MCVDHITQCRKAGIDLLVTCTLRDAEAQNVLYAQGRTTKGEVVTNAIGGDSLHQYRVAYDAVPCRAGKPIWGTKGEDGKIWQRVGLIGEDCGLEWAGTWIKFREFPHFQYTHGLSLADFKAGKTIPQDIRRSA